MINHKTKILLGIVLIFFIFEACDKGSSTPDTDKQTENPLPTKVQGTLPVNGEPCSDFTVVPNDNSKASILFKWNASQNAVNYDLIIMEGTQEVAKTTVGALETSITLDKGKTYSWTVTAKNEAGTITSDTYSFTAPGEAIGNYAPYAAEIIFDFDTTNQTLNINWTGEDEDGDALVYDILVKENETVVIDEIDLANTSIPSLPYLSGASYTVNITAKDTVGNFSISEKIEKSPE